MMCKLTPVQSSVLPCCVFVLIKPAARLARTGNGSDILRMFPSTGITATSFKFCILQSLVCLCLCQNISKPPKFWWESQPPCLRLCIVWAGRDAHNDSLARRSNSAEVFIALSISGLHKYLILIWSLVSAQYGYLVSVSIPCLYLVHPLLLLLLLIVIIIIIIAIITIIIIIILIDVLLMLASFRFGFRDRCSFKINGPLSSRPTTHWGRWFRCRMGHPPPVHDYRKCIPDAFLCMWKYTKGS